MDQNQITQLTKRNHCVAFHEAGHAAGIHLNNQANQLPSVFFKIILSSHEAADAGNGDMAYQTPDDISIAKLEGGRLIETLPSSMDSLVLNLSSQKGPIIPLIDAYLLALDTDVINLMVGPLAQAKHVALTDNEPFNHQLVNVQALENYGGRFDLALIDDYLDRYCVDSKDKSDKLQALFNSAFAFVNNAANWAAISKLAQYILGCKDPVIACEKAVAIIEQSLHDSRNRRVLSSRWM